MDEIYVKEFVAGKSYIDNYIDVRNKALNKVNSFFNIHTGYKALNIIEEWSSDESILRLIVYYY